MISFLFLLNFVLKKLIFVYELDYYYYSYWYLLLLNEIFNNIN